MAGESHTGMADLLLWVFFGLLSRFRRDFGVTSVAAYFFSNGVDAAAPEATWIPS